MKNTMNDRQYGVFQAIKNCVGSVLDVYVLINELSEDEYNDLMDRYKSYGTLSVEVLNAFSKLRK